MFKSFLFFLLFFGFLKAHTRNDLSQESLFMLNTDSFPIELISPYSQIPRGEFFLVGLRISLPKDWNTYWSFSGDSGVPPLIHWAKIEDINIQALPFPRPERKPFSYDDFNETIFYTFIYENELLIPFKVFVSEEYEGKTLSLSLDISWGVCKDICVPLFNQLSLELKLADVFKENSESKKVFDSWKAFFPKAPNFKSYAKGVNENLIFSFVFEEETLCLDIFPKEREHFSTSPPVLIDRHDSKSCSFRVKKAESNISDISGLLIYFQNGQKESSIFEFSKN